MLNSRLLDAHSKQLPVLRSLSKKNDKLTLSKDTFSSFSVNGRFLAQPVTGVQRYAREITLQLDKIIQGPNTDISFELPSDGVKTDTYKNLKFQDKSLAKGHFWEQAILPFATSLPLLNLCNLAPAINERQIACIHDANIFNAPNSYSRSFRAVYSTLLPIIARRSRIIATVSNSSAEDISKFLNIEKTKIFVLPNGHEHVFSWNAQKSNIFNLYPHTRPYVLLLGSKANHKNMRLIFGIADELDKLGIDVRVTGSAYGIFAEIKQKNQVPARNIIELGSVGDDDLAALFSKALCLVFPSFTEGFGLPIVEAMALNCPVVSSDRASMPEVCSDAALLASPDDPKLWLSHIKNLNSSSDLQQQCKERGAHQVKKFSWEASALGYIELFNRYF